MNKIFNPSRFWLLLKKDVIENYRIIGLIILSAIVIAILAFFANPERDFYEEFFPAAMLIAGFIFASMSFNELHSKDQRHVYLSLPASNLEKFLSKLFLSTVGFALALSLIFWIFSVVFSPLVANTLGTQLDAFNPLAENPWLAIRLFVVLQSIFLLGSVYFNHYAFVKTNGALLLLAIILVIIFYLLARTILATYFEGWTFRPHNVVPSTVMENFMEDSGTRIAKNLFWFVLAPFLWVVAYFKLKEREA